MTTAQDTRIDFVERKSWPGLSDDEYAAIAAAADRDRISSRLAQGFDADLPVLDY